jgi:isoaspartyl peptidase/L-asparaginase-like protein (Ntn-hydrolase superfamily)
MSRSTTKSGRFVLAIHGGAGTIRRAQLTSERERRYHEALRDALKAGYAILAAGGTSLDAVTASVISLEDCPLFNAGRGAVFNARGRHELDAAIMDGASLNAGAVAGVRRAKNPIRVARAVMERSPHVLLGGVGADAFARKQKLELVAPDHFSTPQRLLALQRAKQRERDAVREPLSATDRHGTVGAVARDVYGNLAAATSTGGFTNKLAGRIGDSPVVGAGTYADNDTCAVSSTGDGDFFLRAVFAYDLSARMRYAGEPLARAARNALARVAALGGTGGLVAVDRAGRVVLPFNTEGMYRGFVRADGELAVDIF